jgi:polyphenol oxidase
MLARFPELTCGMSTRQGGVSPEPYGLNTSFNVGDAPECVEENRRRFLDTLGISPDRLAIPQQRHTATIRKVDAEGTYEQCDALTTNVRNLFLSVSIADCAPVFLFDAAKKIVACVHAGWRGTEQRILEETVVSMHQEYGSSPENIYAFIGPSAGACCYEVGEEVAEKFEPGFVSRRNGRIYLDIKQVNREQLRKNGTPGSNIEVHKDCTICSKGLYHSYRRDREQSGRMMAVIGLNR